MDIETLRILLLAVVALPLVAAVVVALAGQAARAVSLAFALVHLCITIALVVPAAGLLADPERHPPADARNGQVFLPEIVPGASAGDPHVTAWEVVRLSPEASIHFHLGLDGLNIWLVVLASFLILPALLASWGSVRKQQGAFYAWLFVLQAAILGVFLSFDLVLFYVFFELTLIPAFFLIGVWGESSRRHDAARKFFLYTLAGSLLTLVGLIGIVLLAYQQTDRLTFAIPELVAILQAQYSSVDPDVRAFWSEPQYWIFLALSLGFIVKIPLVPVHSWLPDAYAEAPTGVTVMLSGVLAKMGTFGLIRVLMPCCPDATLSVGIPFFGTLAAFGIIYGALCAYAQSDMKRMVAYSSISHLGFCALALLAFNSEGLAGGTLHMVNHGLATGALFLLVGMLADRYGTTQIGEYGGLWNKLPVLTFFMFVVVLANIGIPALNNFVSEMLMLAGLFELWESGGGGVWFAVAAAFGIFLSAWYLLTMMQRVFFGPLRESRKYAPADAPAGDLNGRELAGLLPLTALILALGCFPSPVLDVIRVDADALDRVAEQARERAASQSDMAE